MLRLPIKKQMVNILLASIKRLFMNKDQPYLAALYLAMFSTYYYGLFRIGELACSNHMVRAIDTHIGINKNKILFILCTSKMHWTDDTPQSVKISATKNHNRTNHYCPYELLRNYVGLCPKFKSADEPFFVNRDRIGVQPRLIRMLLKSTLNKCGFNPHNFSVHSLRSGRASDLLSYGVSVETIKKLGRWKSNAVFKYLK